MICPGRFVLGDLSWTNSIRKKLCYLFGWGFALGPALAGHCQDFAIADSVLGDAALWVMIEWVMIYPGSSSLSCPIESCSI